MKAASKVTNPTNRVVIEWNDTDWNMLTEMGKGTEALEFLRRILKWYEALPEGTQPYR